MHSIMNPYLYADSPELLSYESAWVNYIKSGNINLSVIKPEIAESWHRCRVADLSPTDPILHPLLSEKDLLQRIEINDYLIKIAYPHMESLYNIMRNKGFIINFVDAEGYILKSIGDEDMFEIFKSYNSGPGANRLETVAGTNSIGLAIETGKPIQVAGAEHYIQDLQCWTCSSAPVVDNMGKIICVLNVTGRYEMLHPASLGMISSLAKAIENELNIKNINMQLIEKISQLQATVELVSDGVTYISGGEIIQMNQRMCDWLGMSSSEVLRRSINEMINTTPNIHEYINSNRHPRENEKIILHGEKENYRCFLNIQSVQGEFQQEIGKVLTFRRQDEIKALASRIKYQANITFNDIIGESQQMQKALNLAQSASEHNVRIVLEGDSGTGKEMFAQAIHNNSERVNTPFIPIDCGALPLDLLESELFGYDRGAFTGAKSEGKPGIFELANGGTIFLDEIGNMPLEMQQKLLRVLQENVVRRVGGIKPIPIDVRIIAATNESLESKINEGTFRQDLFYRLSVMQIKIPNLRERKSDIPLLIDYFLGQILPSSRTQSFSKAALSTLMSYDWPGNVRQLINVIEYATIISKEDVIKPVHLPLGLLNKDSESMIHQNDRQLTLKQATEDYVYSTIKNYNNNISKAADALEVSRTTVYRILKESSYAQDSQLRD